MKNFFDQIFAIAKLIPFLEKPVVRNAWIIAAEHDLVLKPAADIALQGIGKIFRRPTRQLPEDISLMQRDRDHLFGPWPSRMCRDDRQIGKIGSEAIDGLGM